MAKILSLYAGPGTGKSTTAAYLYYLAKQSGINAELVREYVKDWAWEGRKIGPFDQYYFMGKQIRKESMLYGKVDFIVTDSPIWMGAYYAWKFTDYWNAMYQCAQSYYMISKQHGHEHYHVFLNRSKKYNPSGRYQTEEQAKEMDVDLKKFMTNGKIDRLLSCDTDEKSLKALFKQVTSK